MYEDISRDGSLKDYIEERVIEVAKYIIDIEATVREAAKVFKVSKSTILKTCQNVYLR